MNNIAPAITLVSHYYNNPTSALKAIDTFRKLALEFGTELEFILIDDHSTHQPESLSFEAAPNLRVFRLKEDIAWNMPGARNIGFKEAKGERVFIFDIDHELPETQFHEFIDGIKKIEPHQKAHFPRVRLQQDGSREVTLKPHINTFAMHKKTYWTVGGYEELFSGHYGHEDKYFAVCCRQAGIQEVIVNAELSVMKGTSTRGLDRDKSVNTEVLNRLLESKRFKAQKVLQFDYELIFSSNVTS